MSQRSVKRKGFVHSVPQIYGCYLLRSVPKPSSFYIGSTPDPVRRLRQHNGDLTAGAYRTKRKGYRPWDMVMFVYGFPNKIAALQFEHAWAHPYQTRHIEKDERITTSRTSGRSYAHKVGNVRLLLKSSFFNKMNLKLQFFNNEAYKIWIENKFHVPSKVELLSIGHVNTKGIKDDEEQNMRNVKEFKTRLVESEQKFMDMSKDVLQEDDLQCSLCPEKIDYVRTNDNFELVSICYHGDCHDITHLDCLRTHLQSQKDDRPPSKGKGKPKAFELPESDLIPYKGKCPSCEKILMWSEVVLYSTRIRMTFGYGGTQPGLIEEECDDDFEEVLDDNKLLQSQKLNQE